MLAPSSCFLHFDFFIMLGPSQSPAQDPSAIPIPNTPAGRNSTENQSLGAQNAQTDKERRSSSKNFVKRAVEHTTAKLSASSSSSSLGKKESDSKNGRSPAGSRSLLSLTRTRPGKERDVDTRSALFTTEGESHLICMLRTYIQMNIGQDGQLLRYYLHSWSSPRSL